LLAEFLRMPATVIAERVGWTRSMTVMKDRVRELRPLYLPADPCQRTEYQAGELAQWDLWFPAVKIPLDQGQAQSLPVIVGVSGYSRWITAGMIPSREVQDILSGHLACLLELGGVPRKGVTKNVPRNIFGVVCPPALCGAGPDGGVITVVNGRMASTAGT
jgi:hypothetical protein